MSDDDSPDDTIDSKVADSSFVDRRFLSRTARERKAFRAIWRVCMFKEKSGFDIDKRIQYWHCISSDRGDCPCCITHCPFMKKRMVLSNQALFRALGYIGEDYIQDAFKIKFPKIWDDADAEAARVFYKPLKRFIKEWMKKNSFRYSSRGFWVNLEWGLDDLFNRDE